MKKQVVVVHGGEAYTNYDNFINHLKNKEVDFDTFFAERDPRWKDLLRGRLGDGYEVATPRMPNPANAKFGEWKIWFERIIPFLRDDVVLIGHSLGAMFVAKYLSENVFPVRLKKVFLIAPALFAEGLVEEDGGDFFPDKEKLTSITSQCPNVFLFHSEDDDVCPYADSEEYAKRMPEAEFVTFTDRGHFMQEDVPELIERIART